MIRVTHRLGAIAWLLLPVLALPACMDRSASPSGQDLADGVQAPSPDLTARQEALDDQLDAVTADLESTRAQVEAWQGAPADVTQEIADLQTALSLTRQDVASLATDETWQEDAERVQDAVDALKRRMTTLDQQVAQAPTDDAPPATADGD